MVNCFWSQDFLNFVPPTSPQVKFNWTILNIFYMINWIMLGYMKYRKQIIGMLGDWKNLTPMPLHTASYNSISFYTLPHPATLFHTIYCRSASVFHIYQHRSGQSTPLLSLHNPTRAIPLTRILFCFTKAFLLFFDSV